MKALIPILIACAALAQDAGTPGYQPDPKQWKLFLLSPMGGWTTSKSLDLTVKVVDPRDPKPPKEGGGTVDEDLQGGGDEEGPSYYEGLKQQEGEEWSAFMTRVQVARKQNAWRTRKLEVYFNGVKQVREVKVGYKTQLHFELQDGENRLELRQPDSGKYAVRTLFATQSRDRLVVHLKDDGDRDPYSYSWFWGGLQVVEPGGTESIRGEPTPSGGKNHGSSYTHLAPPAGTWTVRFFDPRAGVDGYGYDEYYEHSEVRPVRVVAEIILDGGTDRERRWRFERLVMPGTKRVTLGSFDVED